MTAPSLPRWPRIVAEALRDVPASMVGVAPRLFPATLGKAVAVLGDLQTAPRAGRTAPIFLRAHQVDPWRRVMAALDQHGAALLAEGVGRGKTWIALAAAAQTHGEVVAIVPAILRGQWELAARRSGVRLTTWSLERISRGRLPSGQPALVILDEAHRLREPTTKRVQHLAPWLIGRQVLACTATPIVNRIADLAVLLHLMLRDDALAWDGLRRLRDLPSLQAAPGALRRLVIRTELSEERPLHPTHQTRIMVTDGEVARTERGVAMIGGIQGSHLPGIGALVHHVLLDALASSDAALRAALLRYRALLLQAHDAGGSSRAELRRFAGAALDQLVFWTLLPTQQNLSELPLEDITPVEHLLGALSEHGRADEAWLAPLFRAIGDDVATVFFTRHTATARLLRLQLGDSAAWITGSGAGIGPHRTSREMVLTAFGPDRGKWRARTRCPLHLVATDVAAEGLDLQGAGRIVHLDLPWTATKLRQREGRLLRPGQLHDRVQIVTRDQAPAIARTLAPVARVARKEKLAQEWLRALEERDESGVPFRPAAVPGRVPVVRLHTAVGSRDLVVLAIHGGSQRGHLWLGRENGGPWCPQLAHALRAGCPSGPSREHPAAEGMIGEFSADDIVHAHGILQSAAAFALAWSQRLDRGWAPTLAWRIQHLARRAARERDAASLTRLDALLRWIGRAPSLGDLLRAEGLSQMDDDTLKGTDVPLPAPVTQVRVYPVALLLFRSDKSLLRCPHDTLAERAL